MAKGKRRNTNSPVKKKVFFKDIGVKSLSVA